jgi:prepilin-type N-terminal cleavage/methylation domain-containing protein
MRQGFTLVELLLVISLLAVLAMVLWPNFDSVSRSRQLDESTGRMRSLVAMCRAEAMNQSRMYRVAIHPDGTLKVEQQVHPIRAPQLYGRVRSDWVRLAILLDSVWVESVTPLPEGPPPVLLDDEVVEYEDRGYDYDLELEPIPMEEYDGPVLIEFRPDGTSTSLRWVLREQQGRGVEMTLDGRLGRISVVPVEPLDPESVERPEPWDDPNADYDAWDDWEELEGGPWQ